jgi:RNA polymerase sigma-70 factor (ECF subfamily)
MATATDDDPPGARLEALHAESWSWALVCCAGDVAAAEEVLHMSYHKILAQRARFDGQSSFKTWLFGVIRLTAADQRRWDWRRWLRFAPLADAAGHLEEGADAHESLVRRERCAEVRAALGHLAARQAEVLRLVFFHDMTLDEAAAVMGISPGSARTHYVRGKDQLRRRLTPGAETP